MRVIGTILITVAIVSALSGCVINVSGDRDGDEADWRKQQDRNVNAVANLAMGRSRADLVAELGQPDFSDAFERDDGVYTVLFYLTRHLRADGRTTRDETTPIVFRDDRVVGWGDSALAHYVDD